MPVQKLKIISGRSNYKGDTLGFQGVSLRALAKFWRLVQQWKYPAQLRDAFLEWMRDIFSWLQTPARARRSNSSKLPLISLTKIRRFPRPPGPVRWAAASIFLIFIPIVLINLLFPEQPSAWYNSSWTNRKAITIDHTKVAGSSDHANFPVLVSITDSDLLAQAQADGDDILFTAANGTTKLDHEIESYTSGTGALVAWVRIPTLDYDNNTVINMYYGNGSASSQQNATAVWDSNYKGTWHLSEDPSTGAPQMQESTSNNFDGTSNGTMTSGDQVAGKTNGALDFDGSNDYIGTGNQTALNAGSAFTISGWINRTANSPTGIAGVIAGKWNGTGSSGWFLEVTDSDQGAANQIRFFVGGLSDTSLYSTTSTVSNSTWYYVTAVYNGSNKILYMNGSSVGSEASTGTPTTTTDAFQIGYDIASGATNNYFAGILDEIRVSNTARSADWITTEYNNQSSPSTFYTLGTEETEGASDDWYNAAWPYRKAITVDHTLVLGSTDLADFPMLVSITDADLLAHAQADADDIFFTAADGLTKLDHEIESYNSGTGALVAWVRIPALDYDNNTIIHMYYGNSGASNQESVSSVWNNAYQGVWHLAENPAGTAPQMVDSTSNVRHGTSNGTMTSGDQVAGKLNGSLDFDGSNDTIVIDSAGLNTLGNYNAGTAFTFQAWVKTTSTANQSILNFGNSASGTQLLGMQVYTNKLNFQYRTNNNVELAGGIFTSTTAINNGSWHFVTIVRSGSTFRVHVNGSQENSTTSTGYDNMTINRQTIGAARKNTTSEYFVGGIDNVRVLNTALSADWITTEYNNQNSPSTFYSVGLEETPSVIANSLGAELAADANLIGHWKLDDNTGASATDSSGNSYTGTLVGNATWVNGKFGSGVTFDGTGDRIGIDNSALNSFGSYNAGTGTTVMAWIKTTATANQTAVSFGSSSSGTPLFNMTLLTTGVVRYQYRTDNNQELNAGTWDTTVTVNDGNWHHVALRRSGNTFEIYVDGVLAKTGTSASTYNTLTGNTQTIGAWRSTSTSQEFNGQIDDVRIYSDARTPGEIVMDMNAGHPLGGSPIASQLLYWGLDEQQGQTAASRGFSSGKNGTFGTNTSVSTDDPTWKTATDCKVNGCLSFDGGDYVKTANNALDGLSTQASVSLWFKTSSTGENLLFSNEGYHAVYMNFGGVSGKMTAFFDGSSGGNPSTALSYNDNTWHHMIATNNGTTTKLYIDGKKVLDFSETFAAATSTQPFVLGAQYTGATSFYTGSLDELKVYTAALSESEILIDLNAGSAINFNTGTGVEAAQLSDGAGNPPVGYWKLDENTGTTSVVDSSGNNLTGTLAGSMTAADWVPGNIGSALDFDGTDDAVSFGTTSVLKFGSGNFTYSAWVKTSATGATDVYIADSNNATAERLLYTGGANTAVCFARDASGNSATATGTTTITNGVWHHLACVRSGSSVYIYVDGRLEGSGTNGSVGSTDTTPAASTTIAKRDNAAGLNMAGLMDEVKIYNYARTAAQVAYDYNRGGPVGWWKFDECTGTTAYDSSGNANNGTITIGGTGTYTSAGTCGSGTSTHAWNAGTVGKLNASLGFDGTNDYIDLGSSSLFKFTTSPFSLSAWIYMDTNNKSIISSDNASTGFGLLVSSDKLRFVGRGTSSVTLDSNTSLTTGQWYHVAMVYTGANGNRYLYINGILDASDSFTGSITSATSNLFIGQRADGIQRFGGRIDDVRIYNYALSLTQITQIIGGGTAFFGPATGSP